MHLINEIHDFTFPYFLNKSQQTQVGKKLMVLWFRSRFRLLKGLN